MQKRKAQDFGDEYVFLANSSDLHFAQCLLGQDWHGEYASMFIKVKDADYVEVWASTRPVPNPNTTYWRVYPQTINLYAVMIGLYGCLPDTVFWCRTLGEARDIAKAEKAMFLDGDDYRVSGDIRRDGIYDVLRKDYTGDWDSWQYIEIMPIEVSQEEWDEYREMTYRRV